MSSDESCAAKVEDFSITNSTDKKLLGEKIDTNLSFENHVMAKKKKKGKPEITRSCKKITLHGLK